MWKKRIKKTLGKRRKPETNKVYMNSRSPELIKLRDQKLCDCFYFLKQLSDLPEEEILKRMSERLFFLPISNIKRIIATDLDISK